MGEINVQLNNGPAAQMSAPVTVADALKTLDREAAKQALAARVNGREVDLAYSINAPENGDAVKIEPVLPQTLAGLDVLRHSTAHVMAQAVLHLWPEAKIAIGPAIANPSGSSASEPIQSYELTRDSASAGMWRTSAVSHQIINSENPNPVANAHTSPIAMNTAWRLRKCVGVYSAKRGLSGSATDAE